MAARMICKINIGAMYQTIYIENEKYEGKKTLETYQILLKDFPDFIAKQIDVPDIYIKGISHDFFQKIEEESLILERTKYNRISKKKFHYI